MGRADTNSNGDPDAAAESVNKCPAIDIASRVPYRDPGSNVVDVSVEKLKKRNVQCGRHAVGADSMASNHSQFFGDQEI
jgi:hypothetical protein